MAGAEKGWDVEMIKMNDVVWLSFDNLEFVRSLLALCPIFSPHRWLSSMFYHHTGGCRQYSPSHTTPASCDVAAVGWG